MTEQETADRIDVLAAELGFADPVDRTLVHRAAESEVFLTDLRPVGDRRFVAAAHLPLGHGYFGDHVQRPALVDPLLILEAGRQAGIGGSHLMGLPRQIQLLVRSFSLRLDPDRLGLLAVRAAPGELRIDNVFQADRVVTGRVRAGTVRQRLYVAGQEVGQHVMQVHVLTTRENELLRDAMRDTPPPSTADLPDRVDPEQAEPATVGRTDPLNVTLAGVARGPDSVSARVAPRLGNRSLFDHPYDHLPAMTLTESARQLALVLLDDGTGRWLTRMRVCGVDGTFRRFAELDRPVVATARAGPSDRRGEVAVRTAFTQESLPVAESTVTLVPATAIGADDD